MQVTAQTIENIRLTNLCGDVLTRGTVRLWDAASRFRSFAMSGAGFSDDRAVRF